MADEKIDPIADMMAVDNEAERLAERGEPAKDLNVEPPEDKKPQERADDGKFKGKDEKAEKAEKPTEPAKVETKAEGIAEKPKETVPLATFLEKTNRLKADLEARDITLNEFKTKLAALEAKLAPQPAEDADPDFIEDPKGYVDAKLNKALAGIAEANKKAETSGDEARKTAAQATEAVQLQRFQYDLVAHEQRFVAANPDYYDALAHVRNVRAAQLREFVPDITEAQIAEQIRGEETNLAVQLARAGRDPVQTAYNIAGHYGYKKAAVAPAPAASLPEPTSKRLPPDQTLGSGSHPDREVYREGEVDPTDVALASLFRKRA